MKKSTLEKIYVVLQEFMCKINDSESPIKVVIHSKNDYTETYAIICSFILCHIFCLSLLFIFIESAKKQNLLNEKQIARHLITLKLYVMKINHLVRQNYIISNFI